MRRWWRPIRLTHSATGAANLNGTTGDFSHIWLAAVIIFPSLALGLSGFETGVSVMPLIRGDAE